MQHFAQLESTRELVQQTLQQLEGNVVEDLQETILICDGCYCGRRFRSLTHHAIWFIEENELKFYGPDGVVVREAMALVHQHNIPLRRAA